MADEAMGLGRLRRLFDEDILLIVVLLLFVLALDID